jgi:hypothetical protein
MGRLEVWRMLHNDEIPIEEYADYLEEMSMYRKNSNPFLYHSAVLDGLPLAFQCNGVELPLGNAHHVQLKNSRIEAATAEHPHVCG